MHASKAIPYKLQIRDYSTFEFYIFIDDSWVGAMNLRRQREFKSRTLDVEVIDPTLEFVFATNWYCHNM